MTTHLEPQERTAIARLHALLELLPGALDQRLRPAGITSFEYTLLESLTETDGGFMRMSELARKTNATLPRLSRVATSLERRGLAARVACPEDARATNLMITDDGSATHRSAGHLYDAAIRELILSGLETLPGDGVTQLADVTYAVLTSLDPEHRSDASPNTVCAADPALL